MANGSWFDNLTRALAGGGGRDRRGFLRLLLGGAAGATLGAVLPNESVAAPASQGVCSPRPRVAVTNTPTSTGLTVSVSATGAGNSLQRITFGALRNGVIDVAGVVTGGSNGYSYAIPAGATQTTFTVRAVDSAQVVQIPFTVTDACGDWRTFVGTGAGALRNPDIVCKSGKTTLTALAPAGSTSLQVANPGCFKVGDLIRFDPGGASQEEIEVVAVSVSAAATASVRSQATGGTVTTRTGTRVDHFPDSEVDRRLPVGYTCFAGAILDQCNLTSACCTEGNVTTGTCCPLGQCCNGRCCAADATCCGLSCCPAGRSCCLPPAATVPVCVDLQTDRSNCGVCGNACAAGATCVNGRCNTCAANRAPCGGGCCSVGSTCIGSTCRSCGCKGNNTAGATNTCLCGSGPTCDASQGLECRNGQCVCAAHPGNKLAFFSCDFNPGTGAYDRILYECENSVQTICKKIDGSPDEPGRPPYSCSTSSCNPGYVPINPICTS